MRNILLVAGVAGLIGVFSACGGDNHPTAIGDGSQTGGGTRNTGGTKNTAGKSSGTPDGGVGGEGGAFAEADGLTVAITAPTAAVDPNVDEVIVGDTVKVVCTVNPQAAGTNVDASTVRLEVLDADGNPAVGMDKKALNAVGVPTGTPNDYSAPFNVAAIPTGVVSFRCSATSTDKSAGGKATVSTFVDHGPTIVPVNPQSGSAHPLQGVLPVEFTVTPTPLTDGDDAAKVTGVTLQVAGVEIKGTALMEDPKKPGTYRAGIDFTDSTLFKEPPKEHTSVHIEATNARSPMKATAITDYPIVVDGKGPVLTFTKPGDNAAVHGETVVEFAAVDSGAGLDLDSLQLDVQGIGTQTYSAKLTDKWSRNGDTFTYRFDTGLLVGVTSQITIKVRAQDAAGNLTEGVTLFLYRDDLPPLIDLDPGNARTKDYNQLVCSKSFDPLGAALNDGATTTDALSLFRAIVYDRANFASGQPILYISGTNQKSVALYIQPDPSQPFLIDTNNDGRCDALARDDFKLQTLKPVKKAGATDYAKDYATAPSVSPDAPTECALHDPSGQPAKPLCTLGSDMSIVVQHDVQPKEVEPVVYAMGGIQEPECTGSKWELHSVTSDAQGKNSLSKDGWICLAARASDNLGNTDISRPLRICFDDPLIDGVPDCAGPNPPAPPSCTTNCTPPPAFGAHIFRF
jgi:hypothetical protein